MKIDYTRMNQYEINKIWLDLENNIQIFKKQQNYTHFR